MSFLSVLGSDIKKVFGWLSSPKGQAVIAAGEGIIETVYPEATAVLGLANTWLTEIIKAEGIAQAAGSLPNTNGVQKSAAVLNALTPQVLDFAKQHGLAIPTGDRIQAANDALVAFLEAFEPATPLPITQSATHVVSLTPTPAV